MGQISGVSGENLKTFLLVLLLGVTLFYVQYVADIEGCPNVIHIQESCIVVNIFSTLEN